MAKKKVSMFRSDYEEDYRTERQWNMVGKVIKRRQTPNNMYSNHFCRRVCDYYLPTQVRDATPKELAKIKSDFSKQRRSAYEKKYERVFKARENNKDKYKQWLSEQYIETNLKERYDYIVIDTETTGLSCAKDEILQLSIIDNDGNVLFNKYYKPSRRKQWYDAEKIHRISPDMVRNCGKIREDYDAISDILYRTSDIVGYNVFFDIGFISNMFDVESHNMHDVMKKFAKIYGEWNDYFQDYKWQRLTTCAKYYGYELFSENAHNALWDCNATLFCYKMMLDNNNK